MFAARLLGLMCCPCGWFFKLELVQHALN